MSIPVRNIYYLLCYAWNHLQEERRIDSGGDQFTRLADMLGHVLAGVAAGLLKAGLDRDYVQHSATIPGVRGKLEVSETARRQLTWTGHTYCEFDEFSYDVLPNQLIKATARSLLAVPTLDEHVRGALRGVILHMRDVSNIIVQRRDFTRVRIHRNNKGYDFALRLCRLIHENILVDRSDGRAAFRDFRDDEARMGQLFEDFLLSFYKREQKVWNVTRWNIQWYLAAGSAHDLERLPIMRTDIVLQQADNVLVIDAKYYKEALKGRFSREKVRSAHLYQILTYLQNLRPTIDRCVEGMLLYPVVEHAFVYEYSLHGHRIRVATIDLDQPWQLIRSDLLSLIAS